MAIKTPFPDDKHAHIVGSMILVGIFTGLLKIEVGISLLLVFVIGCLIELFQKWFKKDGFFDWTDMVYNMAGAGTMGAIFGLIDIFNF